MKSCKRWTTTGAAVCSLCREEFPGQTTGVLCDLAGPIENTTVVKFICAGCAGPIATAIVGAEIVMRSEEQRRAQEVMTEQMLREQSRGRR